MKTLISINRLMFLRVFTSCSSVVPLAVITYFIRFGHIEQDAFTVAEFLSCEQRAHILPISCSSFIQMHVFLLVD